MRLGFIVLATAATLLASTNATEAATKKTFTITSSDRDEKLDGLYIKDGANKFVILHGDASNINTAKKTTHVDQVPKDNSNKQEERGFNLDAKNLWNKALANLFKSMTLKNYRPSEANMNTRTGRYHPFRIEGGTK